MKYASIIAFAAVVVADTIADIPSCAMSCLANGASDVGCGLTDFQCSCKKSDQLTPAISSCVQKDCTSTTDQQKVITVVTALCAQVGIPINVPAASSGSGASRASTSSLLYLPPELTLTTTGGSTRVTSVGSSRASGTNVGGGLGGSCAAAVTVTVTECGSGSGGGNSGRSSTRISTATGSPPFPTGTTGGISSRTGSGIPSGSRMSTALPPTFTGGASGLQAPMLVGVVGIAAAVF